MLVLNKIVSYEDDDVSLEELENRLLISKYLNELQWEELRKPSFIDNEPLV